MSTVEQYRLEAEQNGVRLHQDIPPYVPEIPGDPKSLERALAAILDNAIKFSLDGGNVDVNAVYEGDEVCVSVKDSGVGIPEEIMPRIFVRFFHTDIIAGHLYGGIGLGLSIAREVVQQHGEKSQWRASHLVARSEKAAHLPYT